MIPNTLLFSLEGLFSQVITIVVGVFIGVASTLLAQKIISSQKKPKFVIEAIRKGDKLGFNVGVKRKMVKDAHVQCNNVGYFWAHNDAEVDKKDLHVGDPPSSFFPYKIKVEYVDDVSNWERKEGETIVTSGGGIGIVVKEITTQETVFGVIYSLPKDAKAYFIDSKYAKYPQFVASIRIIGEGVEEEKDYRLHVGLRGLSVPAISEGKPLMDFVSYGFEIK